MAPATRCPDPLLGAERGLAVEGRMGDAGARRARRRRIGFYIIF